MPQVNVPDFDDMLAVAKNIRDLTVEKLTLDVELKFKEKQVVMQCQVNDKYFQNGKPPSMAFAEKAYVYTGFEDELLPLRLKMATTIADLDYYELRFKIMQMQVELFRTESANNRVTLG
jgi:hypothetical protein